MQKPAESCKCTVQWDHISEEGTVIHCPKHVAADAMLTALREIARLTNDLDVGEIAEEAIAKAVA